MRRISSLLLAGVLLVGCGTISARQATVNWLQQSAYSSGRATLKSDATTTLRTLRDPSTSTPAQHTICEVLITDVQAANSSLPVPDDQANQLLANAYNELGSGANTCWNAGSDLRVRSQAVTFLIHGLAQLSFATIRLDAVASGV